MDNPLDLLLNPHGIVFFGANNAVTTMGTTQLLDIICSGFPKDHLFPVHPVLDQVLGLKAYKSVNDISASETIDFAFIVVSAKHVPGILDDCGKRGVKRAVVVSAGFREMGNTDLNDQLLAVTKKHGIRFLGPNCIGFYNRNVSWVKPEDREKCRINTTWIPIFLKNGGTSIASQSGTFACHIFITCEKMGMGINKTVSVGNEASIDLVDCLEYFEQDPDTRVIGLYIEEIKRGRKFMEVVSRIVKKKPVVAMYIGGTEAGARAGKSHTGAMAGNDKVFDAMAKQVGIIRAINMEELLDYCHALDTCPLPHGDRLCILTNAGGPGANMSDAADRVGLKVPEFSQEFQDKLREKLGIPTAQVRNIVDLTFDLDLEKMYRTIPRTILRSDEIDGMLVYGIYGINIFEILQDLAPNVKVPLEEFKGIQVPLLEHLAKLPRVMNKPVILVNLGGRDDTAAAFLQDRGFPVYEMPHRAVKAFWALNEYRKILSRIEAREKSAG
nr:CoA-binding protein [Candidatus Sigynarchaeota archaeon]